MKIVLDTNCLLVILPVGSHYRCLWEAFRQGKFTLCYTNEVLQEYEELLLRFYSPETAFLVTEMLLKSPNVTQTIPYYKWNLIAGDPDDNKFADCFLNANADFIVTSDKHFNPLKEIDFPPINVIDLDTFKQIISPL